MKSLLALKQQNPKLKVIISVGGWEADGFSDAALTEASREKFAESALALLRQHHADGIDLDWEYPGQGVAGIKFRAEDKENFTRLLKALRETAGRREHSGRPQRRRPLHAHHRLGGPRVLRAHGDGPAARLSRLDQRHEL